jgi:hypothetical protein
MKFYVIDKLNNGMHYFLVRPAQVQKLAGVNRVLCDLNGETFHCALMAKKDGGHYVTIGLKLMKKLKLDVGMVVKPSFSTDVSKYQFEMPKEFSTLLKQDKEVHKIFKSLTPGNQRSLLYLIQQPKSIEKRIERSLLIAERLKLGIYNAKLILKK